MYRFWTSYSAIVAFALFILLGSLLWGGVAFWRLRSAERNDALASQHLQRQQVRQLGAEIQQQVREVTLSLWPSQAGYTPKKIALDMQRQITPRSWVWHAVVLDRKEGMVWPGTPWEGPDDARLLALAQKADCKAFHRGLLAMRTSLGLAATLAAAGRLLQRHPTCSLAPQLRPLLLQDLHAHSRHRRRWLFTSSNNRSLWVMQGPGHLLILRFLQGKYVGIALPLHMAQEALVPASQRRQIARLWLAPATFQEQRSAGSSKKRALASQSQGKGQRHWFPLSGSLTGLYLWVQFRPAAPASRMLWVLLGLSLMLTWCAGIALLVITHKRADWDARKNALFHAITHELKTPVAAQVALLETITRLEPAVAASKYVGALQGETERLQQMLQNILALHHDIPGTSAYQTIDLTGLTHQLLEEFEGPAAARELSLVCEQRTPLWVFAEPTSLALALRNLVDNAIKYSPKGGWISVEISREDGALRWRLRDSGGDIGEALRAQIFAPFVRGESRRVPGSGLGLALAHKLIAQLGGRLVLLPGPLSEGGFCVILQERSLITPDA